MQDVKLLELFSQIHRKLHQRLAPFFQTEGLSITEWTVLWKMKKKKTSRVTELAENVGIPPSTLTGIVDRLVAKEWLKRVPDPEDRRSIILECTPKLEDTIQDMMLTVQNQLQATVDFLPTDRYEHLISDLQTILEHLESGASK